jgi:hypothetical protein
MAYEWMKIVVLCELKGIKDKRNKIKNLQITFIGFNALLWLFLGALVAVVPFYGIEPIG